MTIKEIASIAKSYEHIYIAGHVNPDGDCVGATLGLAQLLLKMNIETKVLLKDVADTYDYLPIEEWVSEEVPKDIDLLITLDSGDRDRFGIFNELLERDITVINVDHHISNPEYGDYNYVRPDMSSTSEMIFSMLTDKSLLDESIASCLYTGIIYDTGGFKHTNTKKSTHEAAGELITYGIDFTTILNTAFFYKSIKGLKIQKIAIERIELSHNDTVAMTYITMADLKALNAYKKHTESIVQMLIEIIGVRCGVFFYETKPGIFKVSLRAKDTIDVCKVAKAFGGGGHIKAAGCTLEMDVEAIKENLLTEIEKQL